MANAEQDIPTLTQVVNSGDESMLNHFDAHQFHPEDENDKSDDNDAAVSVENASEFENIAEAVETPANIDNSYSTELADLGLTELDLTELGLMGQDASEKNLAVEVTSETDKSEKELLNTEQLRQKIDEAVEEAMPGIMAQLKGKLYAKFDV